MLLLLVILGCEKDSDDDSGFCNDLPETGDCLPFEPFDYYVCSPHQLYTQPCDYYLIFDTINYSSLVFNPNNSDEIGFRKSKLYDTGISYQVVYLGFIIYNHKTNTKVFEYEFSEEIKPFSSPSWSVNNELIYSDYYAQLNRFNLSTLEHEVLGAGVSPIWNYDGDAFIFAHGSDSIPFLADRNGIVTDTLNFPVYFKFHDWSESNKLLYDLSYFDLNDQSIHAMPTGAPHPNVFNLCWGATDNEVFIINNHGGLVSQNLEMETFEFIKNNCSGKYYGAVAVSRDKKYMATKASLYELQSGDTLNVRPEIRIMNLDGSEERTLQIN